MRRDDGRGRRYLRNPERYREEERKKAERLLESAKRQADARRRNREEDGKER